MEAPHKNNPYKNNLSLEEERPSQRAQAYRLHCMADVNYERLSWLARRLEDAGQTELARQAAEWGREQAMVASVFLRKAR